MTQEELDKIVEQHQHWNECAPGIHCFITRNEAVNY